jgi:hypothetical protein
MATAKQKAAAKRNIKKAQAARRSTAKRSTAKRTTTKRAGTTAKKTTRKAAKKTAKKATRRTARTTATGRRTTAMSTAQQNRLPDSAFAFPKERKEPINDARHVRNAIARFDQVEDVTDAERDRAWKRISAAAKKYDIEVEAKSWRDLFKGGKAKKR